MKIGYPCINLSLDCRSSKTFRLKAYSEERLVQTISNNLNCLQKILQYNVDNRILFFRITSDLIPFASHPICSFDWQKQFQAELRFIGEFIKKNKIRISMHPDQFTLINSIDEEIFQRSRKELVYHAQVLDLMELDFTAKIQIHVGGVYGDKPAGLLRFVKRYDMLEEAVRKRLVVENDHTSYKVLDCLRINESCGLPVLFDKFHHLLNNDNENVCDMIRRCSTTWDKNDGLPMVD
ncbi:MAG: UV DNA damage repair endonuclease UvsE, partial [Candidatus Omnitrophota bacterium]